MTEEDEPSAEYVKGYNIGYQMSIYEPELLNQILASQSGTSPNDYIRALAKGKTQYEKEKAFAELKKNQERNKLDRERDE